jgi:hypothetical protein
MGNGREGGSRSTVNALGMVAQFIHGLFATALNQSLEDEENHVKV